MILLLNITVVIAVLNQAKKIGRCIDSVICQDYLDWEIIIIDGGSTDGTIEVIEKYGDDIKYWESSKDRGICHAWNKAIKIARGQWFLFLGADDWLWSCHSLSNASSYLANADEKNYIFYGNVVGVTGDERHVGPLTKPWSYHKFISSGMLFSHQGVFHSSKIFSEYGIFDENYKIAGDYELLLRVVKDVSPVYLDNVVVAGMSLTGISHQDDNSVLMYNEYIQAQKKNGLKAPNVGLRLCLIKSNCKKILYKVAGTEGAALLLNLYRFFTGRQQRWKG